MMIQGYPVGWAVGSQTKEPYTMYLIDMPGCAAQGSTMKEAASKLEAIVPSFLDVYRRDGVTLPTPSAEPSLKIGTVIRLMSTPAVFGTESNEPREDRLELVTA